MKYKLLQIKDWENNPYVFRGFSIAQKKNFSLTDYEVMYEGEIDGYNLNYTLEKLFDIFNMSHPEDFKGRSMSVSDVVELDGKMYYCDDFGFKEITEGGITK
jgi:hypothetical protein